MDSINIIYRKKDNSVVADYSAYYIRGLELSGGNYIITYSFSQDDPSEMTTTLAESDYVVYITPANE